MNKDQLELFVIMVVLHCQCSRVTKAKKPADRLPGASGVFSPQELMWDTGVCKG